MELFSLRPSSGVFPLLRKNAEKENDENFEQLQQHALNQFQQILNTNEKHTDEKKYSSVENDDRPKKRKRFTKRRGQGRS